MTKKGTWSVLSDDVLRAYDGYIAARDAITKHCEGDLDAANWQAEFDRLQKIERDATIMVFGILGAHVEHQEARNG